MDTIRIGMVGAGFIAEIFAERIAELDGVELAAVCAGSVTDATVFAEQHGIPAVYTDHVALGADESLDAVYVASPNSLHADQTITLLGAGRNVLVEKPMAQDAHQVAAMIDAAKRADRFLMEAYIAPFEPNIAAIREAIARIPQLRRVVFVKDQYSSRFDAYKAGARPRAFDPAFGGGSLLDLGFYPVSLAVHLFGAPESVTATGVLLESGADGQGTVLLGYDGFEVACLHSKIATRGIDSQVGGELEAIVFDDPTSPSFVRFVSRGGSSDVARASRMPDAAEDLTRDSGAGHMDHEIDAFIALLRSGARESDLHPLANTLTAIGILDEARRQVGVRFPSDEAVPASA